MMGALGLIAGAVPGWEPMQLQRAQHPAALHPRAGWEGGCWAWDPVGLGPTTGIGPCFVFGMETSKGAKDREIRDSEGESQEGGEDALRSLCEQRLTGRSVSR